MQLSPLDSRKYVCIWSIRIHLKVGLMTRIAKLYAQIKSGRRPSFNELCLLAESFGFQLMRTSGSHHIYQHPDVPGNLNLQPDGKEAKPYQVRQFLALINEHNLHIIDE